MSLNRFGVWMERHNHDGVATANGSFVLDSDTLNIIYEYWIAFSIHRVEEGSFSSYCWQ